MTRLLGGSGRGQDDRRAAARRRRFELFDSFDREPHEGQDIGPEARII
jgi:hypothetical protein